MGLSKRVLLLVCLFPFLISLAWLLATICGLELRVPEKLLGLIVGLSFLLPVATMFTARRSAKLATNLQPLAILTPCFLAPLSVLHVWTIGPSNIGLGTGGFRFFLGWLTKYPDFGPVNFEVLLGTLCVLGAGAMPVGFALYALMSEKKSKYILMVWTVLCLIPFSAVLIALDINLWLAGSLALSQKSQAILDPSVLYGPIMRTLPLVSMGITLVKRAFRVSKN